MVWSDPARRLRLGPWYVACIPLVASACLYVGPPWGVPVNEPPIVIQPPNLENDVYVISDPTTLTAVARDPDFDVVNFLWTIPDGFQVGEQRDTSPEEGVYASSVRIARDEDLDGVDISCVFSDFKSDPSPERIWWLEVGP